MRIHADPDPQLCQAAIVSNYLKSGAEPPHPVVKVLRIDHADAGPVVEVVPHHRRIHSP